MAKITLRQLVKVKACREQRAEFAWRFGRSVVVTSELAVGNAGVFDWDWAAGHLLSDAAWAEYEKIRDAAWAEYKKVHAAAWAKYKKVHAAAWAKYMKASAAAYAEYEKVLAITFARLYNRDHEGKK